jgi:hypothetical protein
LAESRGSVSVRAHRAKRSGPVQAAWQSQSDRSRRGSAQLGQDHYWCLSGFTRLSPDNQCRHGLTGGATCIDTDSLGRAGDLSWRGSVQLGQGDRCRFGSTWLLSPEGRRQRGFAWLGEGCRCPCGRTELSLDDGCRHGCSRMGRATGVGADRVNQADTWARDRWIGSQQVGGRKGRLGP